MDNIIHLIFSQKLLLIYRIINHNLINTTNVNSIVMIEEHNKLVPKMITIETKCENMEIFMVEYLHLTKQTTHYSIGKKLLCNKEEPNLLLFDLLKNRN